MAKTTPKAETPSTDSKEPAAPLEVVNPDLIYINTHPDHPLYRKPDPGAVALNDKAGLKTPV